MAVCFGGWLHGGGSVCYGQQTGTQAAAVRNLTGQVLNAVTGQPVPRALVRLNDRAVLADSEGKFELDQISDSSGMMQVIKPGFSMSTDAADSPNLYVQLDQLSGPLVVRLYPEGLLTGTVSAPDGEPLSHISVLARRGVYDESGHRWLPVGFAQTDVHGQFRIPVSAGDYRLQTRYVPHDADLPGAVLPVAVPGGSSPGVAQTIHLHSGEELHFDLHPLVLPTYGVSFKIESNADRATPIVTARSTDGTTLTVNAMPTRVPGQLQIDLPSGSYSLLARITTAETAEIAEANVVVADRDVSGVVMHFTQVPSIPIELAVDPSVTSDNSPPILPQFGLSLQSVDTDGEVGLPGIQLISHREAPSILTAPPGSYVMRARNASQWYIKSASYGGSDLLRQNLVVAPGAGGVPIRLVVSNQTGGLQGTVLLDGKPSYAWVYLISGSPSLTPVYTLRSNSDGVVTAQHLPPGSYQAVAFEHRYSADFTDPATLAAFATRVERVTVVAGNMANVTLDAVPQGESLP